MIPMALVQYDSHGIGTIWFPWHWYNMIPMALVQYDSHGIGTIWFPWHWYNMIPMALVQYDSHGIGTIWFPWHWYNMIPMALVQYDSHGISTIWFPWHWYNMIPMALVQYDSHGIGTIWFCNDIWDDCGLWLFCYVMFVSLFSAITLFSCNHCRPVKARGGEQNFRWNPGDVSGGMLNRKIEGHEGKPV